MVGIHLILPHSLLSFGKDDIARCVDDEGNPNDEEGCPFKGSQSLAVDSHSHNQHEGWRQVLQEAEHDIADLLGGAREQEQRNDRYKTASNGNCIQACSIAHERMIGKPEQINKREWG